MSVENNTNFKGYTLSQFMMWYNKECENREKEVSRVTIKDLNLVHTPLVINKQILTCWIFTVPMIVHIIYFFMLFILP